MSRTRMRPATMRLCSALVVIGLVTTGVTTGRVAERFLAAGGMVDLTVLQLRLAYNTGAAFSVGEGLPGGVVLGVSAVITVAVGVYAWRRVPNTSLPTRLGLVMVLSGALANLIDRADDGAVIDYLHTGWWPTFNLPDVLISVGAVSLILGALRGDSNGADTAGDTGTTSAAV